MKMRDTMGKQVACLLGAMMLVAVGCGNGGSSGAGGGAKASGEGAVGAKPPVVREEGKAAGEAVVLPGVDGKEYTVLSKGKNMPVTVLEFWATWCPACVAKIPEVKKFYEAYKDRKGFRLLAVNLDRNPAVVGPFVKEKGIDYPVLLDPAGDLAQRYGIRAIPTIVVLDASGERQYTGYSLEGARKVVEELLKKAGGKKGEGSAVEKKGKTGKEKKD